MVGIKNEPWVDLWLQVVLAHCITHQGAEARQHRLGVFLSPLQPLNGEKLNR